MASNTKKGAAAKTARKAVAKGAAAVTAAKTGKPVKGAAAKGAKTPARRTVVARPAAPRKVPAAGKATSTAKPRKAAPATQRAMAKTSAAKRPPAAHDASLQHEVEQFLYAQAELLDDKRWQAYIDLFTDDGVYWMPANPDDTTFDGVPSIFAEDRDLMTVRMKRVLHPDAWSQRPLWGTNHVVGNVTIDTAASTGDEIVVRSRFHMMELRRDHVRHFAGRYVHHLRRTPRGLRVRLQRVDMTNAQAAYDYVLQVWV